MTSKISKTKIEKKLQRKENPELVRLIITLKKQKKPVWLAIANLLASPKRKNIAVNILKIDALTKENDIAVVPGKILAEGSLSHDVTIAAFSVSQAAKEKLKNAKLLTIEQLLKTNPQGRGVKIII